MSLSAYALCTVAEVEAQTGKTYTGTDITVVENIINSVTAYVEGYTNQYHLQRTGIIEKFDVYEEEQVYFLKNSPTTITSIHNDGDTITDYVAYSDTGEVYFNTTLSTGRQKLTINYTGGRSSVADDIKQLAIMMVIEIFNRKTTGNLKSESVGNISVSYGDSFLVDNPHFKEVLNKYKTNYLC